MSLLTDEQKERMRKATALRVLKDMSPSEIDERLQSLKDKLDVAEQRIKELAQANELYQAKFGNVTILQAKRDLKQQVKILCSLMDSYEVKVDAPVGYHAVVFVSEIEQLTYRLGKQAEEL